jgi:hypothetical protein
VTCECDASHGPCGRSQDQPAAAARPGQRATGSGTARAQPQGWGRRAHRARRGPLAAATEADRCSGRGALGLTRHNDLGPVPTLGAPASGAPDRRSRGSCPRPEVLGALLCRAAETHGRPCSSRRHRRHQRRPSRSGQAMVRGSPRGNGGIL